MTARILVSGSRAWSNFDMIRDALAKAVVDLRGDVVVVHGNADGADLMLAFPRGESRGTRDAMARARAAGIPVEVYESGPAA